MGAVWKLVAAKTWCKSKIEVDEISKTVYDIRSRGKWYAYESAHVKQVWG